jgi:hypothetical protein
MGRGIELLNSAGNVQCAMLNAQSLTEMICMTAQVHCQEEIPNNIE